MAKTSRVKNQKPNHSKLWGMS